MVSIEAKDASLLMQRGRELLGSMPASAIAHLERALHLDPGHPQAVETLGLLAEGYQAIKRFRECGFLLESCVALEPQDLGHHARLCTFRLTRAHYRKTVEGLRRYLDAGGSADHLERVLAARQVPRSVIRALMALCEILDRVELAKLPQFKNMGEILALEEKLKLAPRPESSPPTSLRLPGLSESVAARLGDAGLTTVTQLASTSVERLQQLGLGLREAETLLDVANSELYLVNSQGGRPAADAP